VIERTHYSAWGKIRKFERSKDGNTDFNTASLLGRGYTGHEHFATVGIIHMNGRVYDPQLKRFLSPDNFVQDPHNTQSYNRYGYVWNNPLKYTDPSGEELITAIIVGTVIGAMANTAVKAFQGEINSFRDFAAAFGIGAVAGAVGGAAAFAGAASLTVGGFVGGAAAGAAGGAAGGLLQEFGNAVYFQREGIGDALKGGLIGMLTGAIGGAVIGGTISGVGAAIKGNNFWTGIPKAPGRGVFSFKNQPKYTSKNVDYSLSGSSTNSGNANAENLQRVINPDTIADELKNFDIEANLENPIYKSQVDKWLTKIQNPNFDASVTKNAAAGFLEGSQKAFITDGHHRIIASTIHGMRTGDYSVLQTMINSGNFKSFSNSFGYKFGNFPKVWR